MCQVPVMVVFHELVGYLSQWESVFFQEYMNQLTFCLNWFNIVDCNLLIKIKCGTKLLGQVLTHADYHALQENIGQKSGLSNVLEDNLRSLSDSSRKCQSC